jgi:hypothetical protein
MTGHVEGKHGASTLPAAGSIVKRLGVSAATWFGVGLLLFLLLSQIPIRHSIDIGVRDAGYVQGFGEGFRIQDSGFRSSDPSATTDKLADMARWTSESSALLFPLAGEPAEIRLRLRGWPESAVQPRVTLWLNGSQQLDDFVASADWQERRVAIRGGQLKLNDFFIEIRSETTTLANGSEVGVLLDRVDYRVSPPTMPALSQLVLGGVAGALLFLVGVRSQESELRTQNSELKSLARPGDNLVDTAVSQKQTKALRPLRSLRLHKQASTLLWLVLIGLGWLLLYRMPAPLTSYPWRSYLLTVNLVLGGLLAVRHGPALALRFPALVRAVLPTAIVGGWLVAVLIQMGGHVTLARPGVENDFRVFATRETLAQIFSADGFYNLGYPLLLWIVRPLYEGNAFLSARLLAAFSGVGLLTATYVLARCLLPSGAALVALLVAAFSTIVAQYGLYVGSDMPFAACVALCIALMAFAIDRTQNPEPSTQNFERTASVMQKQQVLGSRFSVLSSQFSVLSSQFSVLFLAGIAGGCAFLIRHLGLILLPWGLLVIAFVTLFRHEGHQSLAAPSLASRVSRLLSPLSRLVSRSTLAFVLGFVLAMSPQIIVNTAQTGQPFYSQQAKNIWFAVYADSDWARWDEASNDIGLAEIVLRDPPRFFDNWYRNVVAFLGSGGENTSEFGRAIQLRLLGFPANWLAVAGLLAWIGLIGFRIQDSGLRSFSVSQRVPTAVSRQPSGVRSSVTTQQASADASADDPHGVQSSAFSVRSAVQSALLLFVALYVLSVSVAFVLDRFFLPLVPIYAVAAGWVFGWLAGFGREDSEVRIQKREHRTQNSELRTQNLELRTQKPAAGLLLALVLAVVLWGGFTNGMRYVLNTQPADEVAAIELVLANSGAEKLATRVSDRTPLAKYSALAHRVVDWPGASATQAEVSTADIEAARLAGARFLLWDESFGTPPLPDANAALVGSAGTYRLYRL